VDEAFCLEALLLEPDRWDLEVPPEVRIRGIDAEGSYPIGYGRHPEKGWFVLTTAQGPALLWAEWRHDHVEKIDFNTDTREERYKAPLVEALGRLQTQLQGTGS
jgi:hypothetical protein